MCYGERNFVLPDRFLSAIMKYMVNHLKNSTYSFESAKVAIRMALDTKRGERKAQLRVLLHMSIFPYVGWRCTILLQRHLLLKLFPHRADKYTGPKPGPEGHFLFKAILQDQELKLGVFDTSAPIFDHHTDAQRDEYWRRYRKRFDLAVTRKFRVRDIYIWAVLVQVHFVFFSAAWRPARGRGTAGQRHLP